MPSEAANVRLRLITAVDRENVVKLLVEGFARRNFTYWQQAWDRLIQLDKLEGFDTLGYALEVNSVMVGVILILAAKSLSLQGSNKRANLSSWYVKPEYRSFATMLLSRACKDKDITFLNVSAAKHTYAICEALGFVRYSQGQLACAPILSKRTPGLKVSAYTSPVAGLDDGEVKLITDHQSYGCLCLIGTDGDAAQPFIFVKRRIKGLLPVAQLIYCRSIEDFSSYSKHIGAFLAARGVITVILDSNGPVGGLKGIYYNGRSPKYYKGNHPPRIGDLAYTEIALFGI
jgi:hypothetical protein